MCCVSEFVDGLLNAAKTHDPRFLLAVGLPLLLASAASAASAESIVAESYNRLLCSRYSFIQAINC